MSKFESKAFQTHLHWPSVQAALNKITAGGYRSLLAGGCVRDLIMGRTPNDFDIATNASPEELKKLFPESLEVGREFGVTIIADPAGFQLELATFRKDGPYLDGRRPSTIEFADAEQDARRRDFTVNALFYDWQTQTILDFVEGQRDITDLIIRTVGEPKQRFDEDKLRLLRALRFAAQLDFTVEPKTLQAVSEQSQTLQVVSKERIRDEFIKLLQVPGRARGLELLRETELLWQVVPSYPRDQVVWSHTMKYLAALATPATVSAAGGSAQSAGASLAPASPAGVSVTEKRPEVLLSLFFAPVVAASATTAALPPDLSAALKELKFSTQQTNAIIWILENLKFFMRETPLALAELVKLLAHPVAPLLETVCAVIDSADQAGGDERLNWLEALRAQYLPGGALPARLVDGADLKRLGMQPGPAMGRLLEEAYNLQIEKKLNSKSEALAWIKTKSI